MRLVAFSCCVFFRVASCAAQQAPAADEKLIDARYINACGPIACYSAASRMGVECSLDQIVQRCHWTSGQMTTIAQIQNAIASYRELTAAPVRLSPESLSGVLQDGKHVAILFIRKSGEEINHAVCATGFENSRFKLVDYPELVRFNTAEELASVWDGQALLVRQREPLTGWRLALLCVAPGTCLALTASLFLRASHPRAAGGIN